MLKKACDAGEALLHKILVHEDSGSLSQLIESGFVSPDLMLSYLQMLQNVAMACPRAQSVPLMVARVNDKLRSIKRASKGKHVARILENFLEGSATAMEVKLVLKDLEQPESAQEVKDVCKRVYASILQSMSMEVDFQSDFYKNRKAFFTRHRGLPPRR